MWVFFAGLGPVLQALIATLFTWGVTALGAAPVFMFSKVNKRLMNGMLAFAGGVMLAAACWSLLIPALDRTVQLDMEPLPITMGGFGCGGLLMLLGDVLMERSEGHGMDKCSRMLMFSITLHNIPEGLCVGVAFGAAAMGTNASLEAALMLALGIALQNFPEGAAVSLPLLRCGMSRTRAFFMGQLSGMVEPLAGVAGAAMVIHFEWLMPFMLAFAAGAMVYAVAGEIFPESRKEQGCGLEALCAVFGFAVMMTLDVALG